MSETIHRGDNWADLVAIDIWREIAPRHQGSGTTNIHTNLNYTLVDF